MNLKHDREGSFSVHVKDCEIKSHSNNGQKVMSVTTQLLLHYIIHLTNCAIRFKLYIASDFTNVQLRHIIER